MLWHNRCLALPLIIALAMAGCSDDGAEKDQGSDAPPADSYKCHQPPDITLCHRPPNVVSATLWYCEGCGYCSAGSATAACNGFNGDCRRFYDGCVPESYTRCDASAPDTILGLCGDCFFREAGVIPPHCDKLSDAGVITDLGQ